MKITYCHPGCTSVRFEQFGGDDLPHWAFDVQHHSDEEILDSVFKFPTLPEVSEDVVGIAYQAKYEDQWVSSGPAYTEDELLRYAKESVMKYIKESRIT